MFVPSLCAFEVLGADKTRVGKSPSRLSATPAELLGKEPAMVPKEQILRDQSDVG